MRWSVGPADHGRPRGADARPHRADTNGLSGLGMADLASSTFIDKARSGRAAAAGPSGRVGRVDVTRQVLAEQGDLVTDPGGGQPLLVAGLDGAHLRATDLGVRRPTVVPDAPHCPT